MIPGIVLDNFQSWMIQVLLIGSIGAFLPAIFRVRHPRSQLIYCQLLLVICVVLPVLQPWRHPVVVVETAHRTSTATPVGPAPVAPLRQSNIPWESIVVWLLVGGAAARLSWTGLGLWRIHRHKLAATPLYPVPESVQEASTRFGASAAFCISSCGLGPVTFGFLRPVVLLPESFLSMDPAAQHGIVCHELLHVKRRDWLVTVIEEIVAAAFWFHPAIWWLLGQARLSREQLVDAQVVQVIADREPYIHALLAMAGAQKGLDLAPAPLFLRRRHLLQRMHLLVTEVSMSKLRLISSYGVIAVILAGIGWLGIVSFPLDGRAEIKEVKAAAAPQQTDPGYVVNIAPLSYPREAVQKKIEGQVAVELTFNAAGDIVDSRVLSGPEELRRAALESALKGSYSISVARTLQVLVDFKLANARTQGPADRLRSGPVAVPPPPPPPPQVPAAPQTPPTSPVPPIPGVDNTNTIIETGRDPINTIIGAIEIRGLSEPQLSALHQRVDPFIEKPRGSLDIQQAIRDSGAGSPYSISSRRTADGKMTIVLGFGSEVRRIQTPFGPFTSNGAIPTPFEPAFVNGQIQTPVAPPTAGSAPSPFGSEPVIPNLQPISTADPAYPPLARQARIQGVVAMSVLIGTDGKVTNVRVMTGHPLLVQSAIEAVKQWVYPAQASPVSTTATLNFAFQQ
jgi:TonB family protein